MKGSLKYAFAFLCAVPFLMVLGNSMLFPVFPKLQQALGVSEVRTSLVVTSFSVPAGVLIPVAGYLSDRFGRKPVMVPGVLLFGIGALLAGLSVVVLPPSAAFAGILVGRAVQGVGAAGMAQLAMALTADIFQSKERSKALGILEGANGLGKVVSPIAGAVVGLFLWWLPFFIFAALAIPVAVGLWLLVHEPDEERSERGVARYLGTVGAIFRRKGGSLVAVLAAGMVLFFVLFGTLFYLSEVLEKGYRMSELSVGFVLALPVAALSGTSYAAGLYLQRRQPLAKVAVWSGLFLVAAVMLANAFLRDRWALFGAISLLGVGAGAIIPSLTLLITSSTEPKERGLITSLYGGVRFFGVAIGPPLFGLLMRKGNLTLFGMAAAVAGLTAVATLLFIRPRQMLPKGGGGENRAVTQRTRSGLPPLRTRLRT